MSILAFLVSFLASTAGAICGIGGGVIIKPTLDLFQMASVSTISFLSGCTVLSMSLYSVGRGLLAHDSTVDFKTGTPLALGAAIGGVFGKQLFTAVKEAASNPNMVGGVPVSYTHLEDAGTLGPGNTPQAGAGRSLRVHRLQHLRRLVPRGALAVPERAV